MRKKRIQKFLQYFNLSHLGNTSDLLYQEMYRDQREDNYSLAPDEKGRFT